jgi:endonuclease-3
MKSAKGKIALVISRLKRRYAKEMKTSLNHESSWELLVATILSAQSQDAQVNKITPRLFKNLPTVKSYLKLKPRDLYKYVRTLGLYRNKSKNIIAAAHVIHEDFGDIVPNTMEKLITIPGVGRKTANVVLANAFGKNVGIAIDTHCITVANRLFLLNTKNPEKIERKLMEFIPKKDWGNVTHLFIALGRDVCTAKTKHCEHCILNNICPSSAVVYKKS